MFILPTQCWFVLPRLLRPAHANQHSITGTRAPVESLDSPRKGGHLARVLQVVLVRVCHHVADVAAALRVETAVHAGADDFKIRKRLAGAHASKESAALQRRSSTNCTWCALDKWQAQLCTVMQVMGLLSGQPYLGISGRQCLVPCSSQGLVLGLTAWEAWPEVAA